MPRWTIDHSPNLFSLEEKEQLSKSITKIYTGVGLPPFYVQTIFKEVPPTSLFIGGEAHSKFASISILHIARSFNSDDQKKGFLNAVDSILNPVFEPKGLDWEYFVSETPRDLWRINGITPPDTGSDAEKEWFRTNRPVAWKL